MPNRQAKIGNCCNCGCGCSMFILVAIVIAIWIFKETSFIAQYGQLLTIIDCGLLLICTIIIAAATIPQRLRERKEDKIALKRSRDFDNWK